MWSNVDRLEQKQRLPDTREIAHVARLCVEVANSDKIIIVQGSPAQHSRHAGCLFKNSQVAQL